MGDKNIEGNARMKFNLKAKAATGYLILLMGLIIGIGFLFYQVQEDLIIHFYDEKVQATTKIAAELIDGNMALKALEQGVYPPEMEKVLTQLDQIKESMGAKYLYLFTTSIGDGYTYIYTSMVEGDDPTDMLALGDFLPYEGGSEVTDNVVLSGKPSQTAVYRSEWGYISNSFAPVLDDGGNVVAIVGADYDMDSIMDEIFKSVILSVSAISLLVIILILFYLYITNRIVVIPVKKLTKAVADFVSKGKETGVFAYEQLHISNHDEIGELAESFNTMALDLQKYVEELNFVTAEKQRIEVELDVATRIQQMLLPTLFPVNEERYELYATMKPAKAVGGDFYDFFHLDNDHLFISVADVSGKGVPAALFMVIAKTIIKNMALSGIAPDEILHNANNQLCSGNDEDLFVSAFIGILEISTGEFTYSNAGHNLPLIMQSQGNISWLDATPNMVLAVCEDIPYDKHTIHLSIDARLLMYTDGVNEATNTKDVIFGDQKLLNLIDQIWHTKNNSTQKNIDTVVESLFTYADGADQSDDITLLEVRYNG